MNMRMAITMVMCLAASVGAGAQEIVVTNLLDVDRASEVIEVPLKSVLEHMHLAPAQAAAIVAIDSRTGEKILTQIDASDAGSEKLLLLVQLKAKVSETIALSVDAKATKPAALVMGREAQERKDDFAWENELVTYRVYGPALERTGEIASGIDVWSKRVPNFVIDTFYKRDAQGAATHDPALSYHKDNGQGLDSYFVGPTRGCGGTAVYADGKLFTSKNYTAKRVLADGPIRFVFEVTYAPWDAHGVMVTETKRIALDARTHMNRIRSTYTFAGGGVLDLAAGIAVHEGAKAKFDEAGRVATVWDTPQDATAGRIATGLVVDERQHAQALEAAGHALMIFKRRSGEPFTYLAGSGWSKADMPTAADWNSYLNRQSLMLQRPIQITWATQ